MSCRYWPPFYEKEVNGKCVKVLPKSTSSIDYMDVLGLGMVIGVIAIAILPMVIYSKK